MSHQEKTQVITGAFGYSGRHIAQMLLDQGSSSIKTITGHPERAAHHPLGKTIAAAPFNFHDPQLLTQTLRGTSVLYNTYWVRFDYGSTTHQRAVENTKILIDCAAEAGVERFVHVSITNPSLDSPLPYFSGKAELERHLRRSGLSHAILRPTVLFGGRDVLINNIAWILRRAPLFGVPGAGRYGVQPIHVDDLARLAVDLGHDRENVTVDAVGPETFSYIDLVRRIAAAIDRRALVLPMPKWMILAAAKVLGAALHDVVLTPEEIDGLSANLLVSDEPPTGTTSFSQWLEDNAATLGRRYANELSRHFDTRDGERSADPTFELPETRNVDA